MRKIILEKLLYLDRSIQLGKINFGITGHPAPPGGVFQPTVRFNIILSGAKAVTLPLTDGAQTITLNTGDAHYSLPNSWELQSWNSAHEMLCIVPRINYLRVSYYQLDEGQTGMPPSVFLHTGRTYSPAMRHALDAMNDCAGNNFELPAINYLGRALINFALRECTVATCSTPGKSMHTFEQIKRWVENSIEQDIDRSTAARLFQVSPSYVSQLFKRMCGMNFHEYLTGCRLNFAAQLLKNTNLAVYQIADQCGFKSHVHFVRRFREINGMPPGQYRDHYLVDLHASSENLSPRNEIAAGGGK